MKYLLLLPLAALLLAGCGPPSKLNSYSDRAEQACGKGQIAYVNVDEGRYACKGGGFSHDH